MGKKRNNTRVRAQPQKRSEVTSFLCSVDAYEMLCSTGYTKLSHNPEIMAGVNKIADLVSSMTIHLKANTENGDIRIKNGLSKKIDIYPNQYTTRKVFMSAVVRTLLLEGDGNSIILPETVGGYLENLYPVPASSVTLQADGWGYKVRIAGKAYDPSDILHFAINPDAEYYWKGTGYRVTLKEVADTLKQASVTKKGFMESKWKPSMVVRVDGLVDEFASKDGRKKLLEQYVESSKAGEPWLLPSDQFEITEVRPLSLNDIAISDSVKLDKRTVAAILGIPPFVVGEGTYNDKEWDNFISTRIKPICQVIEQELTKKLLLNPDWYFKFNLRSLYSYDIKTLSEVGANMFTRGLMAGNEVRDWLNLGPKEGLDELVILENYIPRGMIGDQSKLAGGEDE